MSYTLIILTHVNKKITLEKKNQICWKLSVHGDLNCILCLNGNPDLNSSAAFENRRVQIAKLDSDGIEVFVPITEKSTKKIRAIKQII